jgi:hypothetical protein
MRWHSPQRVAEERGAPDGVRRFDETGVVNKGQDSVGVARQSCGPLGTVAHCPVGGGLARPHGRGMPAWTSGGSCRKWGGRTPLRPAGPGATCPPHCRCSAHPRGRRPGERPWRQRGSCRASLAWPIASRAIAPPCWPPWRRVLGARRWGRARPRPAAGSRGPRERTSATGRREQPARSAWWWSRTAHRARGRLWRRACPLLAGRAGREQQGPRGRARRSVPVTGGRGVRRVSRTGPSGSGSSGRWVPRRRMPLRSGMPQRAPPCGPWSGAVGCAGPWPHAAPPAQPRGGGPTMPSAPRPAGITRG